MHDPRIHSKVSLEELLQLKRAERPTAEFWSNFERELRQKQLTALVEKRRWWHGVSGLLTRRLYLPAGAAAAAFALVAVRYHAPLPVAHVVSEGDSQIAGSVQAVEMLPMTVVESLEARRDQSALVAHEGTSSEETLAPMRDADVNTAQEEISPSARSIAANLARLEQSEPDLLQAVMGNRLSSSRLQSASLNFESEVSPAGDNSSRYRLIARYADRALSPVPSAPAPVRERIARRLGDGLVDDVSRIGVGANRVSLKF